MEKVLISVAPVAATDTHIDPKKIAEDVLECEKAGAGMVHLHVRDLSGKLTPNLDVFKETVERIREKSNIVIEASTGGVSNLTIQERCAPLYYDKVECASLNVGSVNLGKAVYQNPIDDVRYCVQEILKSGKTPEVEVFEIGMIHTTLQLYHEFKFQDPLLFSIVLGHEGAAPATVEALIALRSFIPDNMLWGITHSRRTKNDIFSAAIGMGARTVRVGFEDSNYIDETRQSDTNAPIVAHVTKLLESMGKAPMTADEARNVFRIGR
ncbi:3-keto-5-aminohexanoate cleavage protein [Hydrogenoanaerobacterium sp.]|uniref:3-keto-5-aminohexanoate cleavage protein n=1 Tax=Hydrogenoanaerobacterium sp. TaxID=2953763 RepID=UPI00289AE235|nr:3-keto-5-aminohexanoate cleavage protein [Hydrogenoanaerobacterium sp.]